MTKLTHFKTRKWHALFLCITFTNNESTAMGRIVKYANAAIVDDLQ